jgi:hypothetical protein
VVTSALQYCNTHSSLKYFHRSIHRNLVHFSPNHGSVRRRHAAEGGAVLERRREAPGGAGPRGMQAVLLSGPRRGPQHPGRRGHPRRRLRSPGRRAPPPFERYARSLRRPRPRSRKPRIAPPGCHQLPLPPALVPVESIPPRPLLLVRLHQRRSTRRRCLEFPLRSHP